MIQHRSREKRCVQAVDVHPAVDRNVALLVGCSWGGALLDVCPSQEHRVARQTPTHKCVGVSASNQHGHVQAQDRVLAERIKSNSLEREGVYRDQQQQHEPLGSALGASSTITGLERMNRISQFIQP